jgi:hypothetical protein
MKISPEASVARNRLMETVIDEDASLCVSVICKV